MVNRIGLYIMVIVILFCVMMISDKVEELILKVETIEQYLEVLVDNIKGG